jgi:SAM-dependent methyltransferase
VLLSLFTPTNNPQWLDEAYDSLLLQEHKEWEWVIVPNGPALNAPLPARITDDARVTVVPYRDRTEDLRIGALKRFACDACRGAAFVEFDHDDLLIPGILTDVAKELAKGAGFVFSDAAQFDFDAEQNLRSDVYSEEFGWESYPVRIYEHEVQAQRSFAVDARSLCQIHYAPDHIRVWSREAYYAAGGHNQTLLVGDDHDLVCRTYLAGVPFAHTGTCGYLYRNHQTQSYLRYNDAVQVQSQANCDKYLPELIKQWCKREKLNRVRLVNIYALNELKSLKTSSIGDVEAFNFLHRIPTKDVGELMAEVYRVLVPGGWFRSCTPSTSGFAAFSPVARSHWNKQAFRYFCNGRFWADMGKPPLAFQRVRCFEGYPEGNKGLGVHVYADLCALKGQRHCGPVGVQPFAE